jgi:hydrogenase expression/formation protein HypD
LLKELNPQLEVQLLPLPDPKPKTMLKNILDKIHTLATQINREIKIMEVCGTHTQAIAEFGLRPKMPKNVKLITGPGCPVCVTDQKDIDSIITLALQGIPIATYGDLMRVPGSLENEKPAQSLDNAKTKGAFVKEVYSVEEALQTQKEKPNLVFFGLGFETTAPMSAVAVKKGLNFYSTHKLFIPAMEAVLKMEELKIDGFIDPGHVSTIVGIEPYYKLKKIRPIHQVIAGFEPLDVLLAIYMLLLQIHENRFDVENEYNRLVLKEGNKKAMELIHEVFEVGNGNWRGFGAIPNSGLELKNEFKSQDAKIIYKNILDKVPEPKKTACACGEVIRGLVEPRDCPLFGKICTPQTPYGPCMVSVEGGCHANFKV